MKWKLLYHEGDCATKTDSYISLDDEYRGRCNKQASNEDDRFASYMRGMRKSTFNMPSTHDIFSHANYSLNSQYLPE